MFFDHFSYLAYNELCIDLWVNYGYYDHFYSHVHCSFNSVHQIPTIAPLAAQWVNHMGQFCSLVLDDGSRCTPPIADIPVIFLGGVIALILCSLTRKSCKAYCGFRRNIHVHRGPEEGIGHLESEL